MVSDAGSAIGPAALASALSRRGSGVADDGPNRFSVPGAAVSFFSSVGKTFVVSAAFLPELAAFCFFLASSRAACSASASSFSIVARLDASPSWEATKLAICGTSSASSSAGRAGYTERRGEGLVLTILELPWADIYLQAVTFLQLRDRDQNCAMLEQRKQLGEQSASRISLGHMISPALKGCS